MLNKEKIHFLIFLTILALKQMRKMFVRLMKKIFTKLSYALIFYYMNLVQKATNYNTALAGSHFTITMQCLHYLR